MAKRPKKKKLKKGNGGGKRLKGIEQRLEDLESRVHALELKHTTEPGGVAGPIGDPTPDTRNDDRPKGPITP
jgi:hypothetical protein